jgi:hypothetical protein
MTTAQYSEQCKQADGSRRHDPRPPKIMNAKTMAGVTAFRAYSGKQTDPGSAGARKIDGCCERPYSGGS